MLGPIYVAVTGKEIDHTLYIGHGNVEFAITDFAIELNDERVYEAIYFGSRGPFAHLRPNPVRKKGMNF